MSPTNTAIGAANKRKRSSKKKADAETAPSANEDSKPTTVEVTADPTPQSEAALADKNENTSLREIKKRERKIKKKLTHIEACEAKIADLPENERLTTTKINDDERRKIAEKPTLKAIHDEQVEIIAAVEKLVQEEDKRLAKEKEKLLEAHSKELAAAKEEGIAEGMAASKQVLVEVVRFLKAAAYRRAASGEEPTEDDEAMEAALVRVYEGNENAVDACEKLAAGAEEPVSPEQKITWARIREISREMDKAEADAEADAAEVEQLLERDTVTAPTESVTTAGVSQPTEASVPADDTSAAATIDTAVATIGSESENLPAEPSGATDVVVVDLPTEAEAIQEASQEVSLDTSAVQESSASPNETEGAAQTTGATGAGWAEEAQEAHDRDVEKDDNGWVNVQSSANSGEGRGRGGRGRGERGGRGGGFRGRGRGRGGDGYRGRGRGFRGDYRGGRGGRDGPRDGTRDGPREGAAQKQE